MVELNPNISFKKDFTKSKVSKLVSRPVCQSINRSYGEHTNTDHRHKEEQVHVHTDTILRDDTTGREVLNCRVDATSSTEIHRDDTTGREVLICQDDATRSTATPEVQRDDWSGTGDYMSTSECNVSHTCKNSNNVVVRSGIVDESMNVNITQEKITHNLSKNVTQDVAIQIQDVVTHNYVCSKKIIYLAMLLT